MGKDMIIKMLQDQLEAANATILQLTLTMQRMETSFNKTIDELKGNIITLEGLLKERDSSLNSAQNQIRGLSKLMENKSERQKPEPPAPKTEEEKLAEQERKAAERKARGNNGAKRNMHFEMETVYHDVYPEGMEDQIPVSTREVTRYRMDPPKFYKDVYLIHTLKAGDTLISAKAPLTPLMNSSFDGSFIAGIAQLRYLYSMPVERIVAYFSENGFNLDKQTAHGLLKKTAWLFDKLYAAMRAAVKQDRYLCCDETYHKILLKADDNNGKGSKKGYIWVIVAVHLRLAYFFYDDGSRSEDVILNELKGYEGTIQSDGLRAYKKVAAQSNGKILRLVLCNT